MVHAQPDATALSFVETTSEDKVLSSRLSYSALESRSNRLGRYLRKRGIGPETVVGIFMERSLEMIIGMLGVLKAGGAYCPLDPRVSHGPPVLYDDREAGPRCCCPRMAVSRPPFPNKGFGSSLSMLIGSRFPGNPTPAFRVARCPRIWPISSSPRAPRVNRTAFRSRTSASSTWLIPKEK